jgi:hypothetical protein
MRILILFLILFANSLFSEKDLFGRNFFIKSGSIDFSIDEDYFFSYPEINQLDIHLSESESLANKKRYLESYILLKSISYCARLESKYKRIEIISQKNISSLLSKNTNLNIVNELSGCYKNKFLWIEDSNFQFQIQVSSKFKKYYDLKEKTNPSLNYFVYEPDETEKVKSIEDIYFLSNHKIKSLGKNRIIFLLTILNTPHKMNLTEQIHYWENFRGMNFKIKESISFSEIEKINSGRKVTFDLIVNNSKKKYIGVERYYSVNQKELFLLFYFPEEIKEIGNLLSNQEFSIQFPKK